MIRSGKISVRPEVIKKEPPGKRIDEGMFQKEWKKLCKIFLTEEGNLFEGLKGTMLYLGIWR